MHEALQTVMLAFACVLIMISIYLCLRNKKGPYAINGRDTADEVLDEERFSLALRELDRIFRTRTKLSGHMLDVVAGKSNIEDYNALVEDYLSRIVNDIEHLFSEITKNKCVVTIKLIVDVGEGEEATPGVITAFRDSDSMDVRTESYDGLEPIFVSEHTFINEILTADPFNAYVASNDLRSRRPDYKNPNESWHRLFNSSAVHAIGSPGTRTPESFYGFLCIDNRHGGLGSSYVRPITSIVSTAIFYVLSASSMLGEIQEEGSE